MDGVRRSPPFPPIAGGERVVEAFASVKVDGKKYLFLLVDDSLRNSQPGSDDLLMRSFGRMLTDDSSLVRAYEGWKAYDEVRKKGWPEGEREAINSRRGPFLLVIEDDFTDFDPRRHRFAILWLEDFGEEGGQQREEELKTLLGKLAAAARDPDRDVFDYIRSIAERRAAQVGGGRARVWENLRSAALDSSGVIKDDSPTEASPPPP